jgi:hypothetical protein
MQLEPIASSWAVLEVLGSFGLGPEGADLPLAHIQPGRYDDWLVAIQHYQVTRAKLEKDPAVARC